MFKKKKGNEDKTAGFLIVAGCLIGLGTGLVYNQTAPGVLIGLGVGFLVASIYYGLKKK